VGENTIKDIIEHQLEFGENAANSSIDFYSSMYGDITDSSNSNTCITDNNSNCVYDICADKCDDGDNKFNCRVCRLAERIWGNCEVSPQTPLDDINFGDETQKPHNRIKKSIIDDEQTLLYWFAVNTGTETLVDSCRDTTCPTGFVLDTQTGQCVDTATEMCFASNADEPLSLTPKTSCAHIIPEVSSKFRCACCDGGVFDTAGNCCESGKTISETLGAPFNNTVKFCASSATGHILSEPYLIDENEPNVYHVLMCDGGDVTLGTEPDYNPICNGNLVDVMIIDDTANPSDATYPFRFYYKGASNGQYDFDGGFVKNVIHTRNGTQYKWYGIGTGTFAPSNDASTNCTEGQSCTNRATQWSVIFNQ
jgi:hypothetical protein